MLNVVLSGARSDNGVRNGRRRRGTALESGSSRFIEVEAVEGRLGGSFRGNTATRPRAIIGLSRSDSRQNSGNRNEVVES